MTRTSGRREEVAVSGSPVSDASRPAPLRLPDRPSLDHLRAQADDLQRAYTAGEPAAVAEVAAHVRQSPAGSRLPRAVALLVTARRYGFASWTRLVRHVELIGRYTRLPDEVRPVGDPAQEFLRLACLTYGTDDPQRRREARRILAEHPDIPASGIHAAAAVADAERVRRLVTADPALARQEGGPHRWEPLCYLAYARHDPDVPRAAVLETARLLVGAGADPNAGYLWHGLTTPFTVLTGVFGEGEQGPANQPRHPHSLALARLLLEAGADANDEQTLYNRMFGSDNDHLEVLFEHGLGTGEGGPWRARLGPALRTPAQLVGWQLHWAVVHGMTQRVRLLAAHGADLTARFPAEVVVPASAASALHGYTPAELAALCGHAELAAELAGGTPTLPPVDDFVAAALAGDRARVERLRSADPGIVATVRAQRTGLIVWAAANRRTAAVTLLAELGFDINAMARSDVPVEQQWQTALHTAVERRDAELVRILLEHGADPDLPDARFSATPLGWALHFGYPEIVQLLEPVTATKPDAEPPAEPSLGE
jgi:ankyrin repeat protein